jgi:hypothetical protein
MTESIDACPEDHLIDLRYSRQPRTTMGQQKVFSAMVAQDSENLPAMVERVMLHHNLPPIELPRTSDPTRTGPRYENKSGQSMSLQN